tara:strand:+ start:234 stop:692 length:459 start_codon:yes stop_codon:yes gene_type:complete
MNLGIFRGRYGQEILFSILAIEVFSFLFFFNIKYVSADLNMISLDDNHMVIENLRLNVPSNNLKAWLKAEDASWKPWLNSQKGFIRRNLFWDKEREEATVMITWATRKDWKSIPLQEINEVQELFEAVAREETGINAGNPFPLIFEGELTPK